MILKVGKKLHIGAALQIIPSKTVIFPLLLRIMAGEKYFNSNDDASRQTNICSAYQGK
jgi:hypothetical protein